jgi:hypothetical protein
MVQGIHLSANYSLQRVDVRNHSRAFQKRGASRSLLDSRSGAGMTGRRPDGRVRVAVRRPRHNG